AGNGRLSSPLDGIRDWFAPAESSASAAGASRSDAKVLSRGGRSLRANTRRSFPPRERTGRARSGGRSSAHPPEPSAGAAEPQIPCRRGATLVAVGAAEEGDGVCGLGVGVAFEARLGAALGGSARGSTRGGKRRRRPWRASSRRERFPSARGRSGGG